MQTNAGMIDRILRVLVGLALIAATLMGVIGGWGWLGLVPLATGALGFCPAYTLLKINTCPIQKRES